MTDQKKETFYSNKLREAQESLETEKLRISLGCPSYISIHGDMNKADITTEEEEEEFDKNIIARFTKEVEHYQNKLTALTPKSKTKPLILRIPKSIIVQVLENKQDLNTVLKAYPKRQIRRPKRFD